MREMDRELLDLLVCPKSKAPLIQDGEWLYSTDRETRMRYPVRDGIPVMLLDEADIVSEEEFDRVVGSSDGSRDSNH
jgi:hypothetical protein